MKRVVSLWLPRLTTDRLARQPPHLPPSHPESRRARDWQVKAAATLAFVAGGTRIAAANRHAATAGIRSGMRLADARALVPDLVTTPAEAVADRRLLDALAGWCERYTPWVAPDPFGDALRAFAADDTAIPESGCGGDAGLLLDVEGCTHLFGPGPDGERALIDDLLARLGRHGFACRAAIADTPGAAWALARFAERQADLICPVAGQRQQLATLPVEGLRLAPASVQTLHRLGLRRIGDLYPLPRGPLTRRFGDLPILRLDQALGRCSETIEPHRPAPAWRTRLAFAEPIGRPEDIAAANERLLAALCAQFERGAVGARQLELALFRVDGTVERTTIGTGRPSREARHLGRLFAERLGELDPGFGVELMLLSAPQVEALSAAQAELPDIAAAVPAAQRPTDRQQINADRPAVPTLLSPASSGVTPADQPQSHRSADGADTHTSAGRQAAALPRLDRPTGELLDRLTQRLGSSRVVVLQPRASHLPERAVAPRPAAQTAALPGAWAAQAALKTVRPIRLLAAPEPIDVTAPMPDDPPLLFRWRRITHRILHSSGPERLIDEWWHGNAVHDGALQRLPQPRDYYRLEDEAGQRFWVYRDGPLNARADTGTGARWYLHGFYA